MKTNEEKLKQLVSIATNYGYIQDSQDINSILFGVNDTCTPFIEALCNAYHDLLIKYDYDYHRGYRVSIVGVELSAKEQVKNTKNVNDCWNRLHWKPLCERNSILVARNDKEKIEELCIIFKYLLEDNEFQHIRFRKMVKNNFI